MGSQPDSVQYDAYYFAHGCGRPYQRDDEWLRFFDGIAARIQSDICPQTVLDAGCAMGFLVETLRNRGVDAWGVDISEYAIEQAHPSIKPYVWVGSVTAPFPQRYDLIVCTEVLEHLEQQTAEQAIANFCQFTDDILFSSSPFDYKEATHFNVQPPEYWAEQFARHGFFRDVDFDATFVSPWAARFRRSSEPVHRLIRTQERRVWRNIRENQDLRALAQEMRGQLAHEQGVQEQLRAQVAHEHGVQEQLRAQIAHTGRVVVSLMAENANLSAENAVLRQRIEEEIPTLTSQLRQWEALWEHLQRSLGWGVLTRLQKLRGLVAPPDSTRNRLLDSTVRQVHGALSGPMQRWRSRTLDGSAAIPGAAPNEAPPVEQPDAPRLDPEQAYQRWIVENEPSASDLQRQRNHAALLPYRPLISVVVPVYNPPLEALRAALDSVLAQTYGEWELCIVDGASDAAGVGETLEIYSRQDARIRVLRLESNLGISGNSNEALRTARGEFVAFLDHDDTLAPWALYEVVSTLNQDPASDLIYSDHDVLDAGGTRRSQPLFKPDWSPEIMLSANYITHLTVVRLSLVRDVGGFDPETDGAQDWDVFLRIAERTHKIVHIPQVLYHWRELPGSTAVDIAAKPYALERQLATIERHLRRSGMDEATATLDQSGFIRVSWPAVDQKVTIIILSKGVNALLERCVDSLLEKTAYRNFELVVVNNGERRPEEFEYYRRIATNAQVCVVHYDGPFNFSAANNYVARDIQDGLLLFLNNDTEVIAADWLDELVRWAQCPEVGAVGAKLLKPDGTIQHAGVVLGLTGFAGHVFAGVPERSGGMFGMTEWYRDYLAVTGACLMMRAELFAKVGGFDEAFLLNGSDVELCLRVVAAGYRVVFNPFARLLHVESATHQGNIPSQDFAVSAAHYRDVLEAGDPYFSPNLSRWHLEPYPRQKDEPEPIDFVQRFVADEQERLSSLVRPAPNSELWSRYSAEATHLVSWLDFSPEDLVQSRRLHDENAGFLDLRSITWFLPEFYHPYYAGIYTILRFADYLQREKNVENRFVVVGGMEPRLAQALIGQAFPALGIAPVSAVRTYEELASLDHSDAGVATLWSTAYFLLRFNQTRRRFYFVQDYEPLFYPAGSTFAQAEATYRFGFYGIANTPALKQILREDYGGVAEAFLPAVDTEQFHPVFPGVVPETPPFTVFFYGRPGHPRNAFELGAGAMKRLKQRMGDQVRIISAGADWHPRDFDLEGVVENLGLIDPARTADLYRHCAVGLVMMFTRHPSYLPFEFMASGCLVVSNHNPATRWLLKDGENCLLAETSATALADTVERALLDVELRRRVTSKARQEVETHFADWSTQIEAIYRFMCNPVPVDAPQ